MLPLAKFFPHRALLAVLIFGAFLLCTLHIGVAFDLRVTQPIAHTAQCVDTCINHTLATPSILARTTETASSWLTSATSPLLPYASIALGDETRNFKPKHTGKQKTLTKKYIHYSVLRI